MLQDSIRLHSLITTASVLNNGALVANCMSTLNGVNELFEPYASRLQTLFSKASRMFSASR